MADATTSYDTSTPEGVEAAKQAVTDTLAGLGADTSTTNFILQFVIPQPVDPGQPEAPPPVIVVEKVKISKDATGKVVITDPDTGQAITTSQLLSKIEPGTDVAFFQFGGPSATGLANPQGQMLIAPPTQAVALDLGAISKDVMQDLKALVVSSDQNMSISIPKNFSAALVAGGSSDKVTSKSTTKAETVDLAAGNDTMVSSSGHDSINTGLGHDSVNAGGGNDTVKMGTGDTVFLSTGNDLAIFKNDNNGDKTPTIIDGGAGTDTVRLENVMITKVVKKGSITTVTLNDDTQLLIKNTEKFAYDFNHDGAVDSSTEIIKLVAFIKQDFSH